MDHIGDPPTEADSISISVSVISDSAIKPCGNDIFRLKLPIVWDLDNYDPIFKFTGEISICESWDDPSYSGTDESLILFSDRQSAVKFKNLLKQSVFKNTTPLSTNSETARELFMKYSTSTEWNRMFEILKTLKVNDLYN